VDSPTADVAVVLEQAVVVKTFVSGEDEHLIGTYPAPPSHFTVGQDVDPLVKRYRAYVAGKEPRPAWAGFTLSYVERMLASGRRDAARKFNIAFKVLDALGFLAAVGDLTVARKVDSSSPNRPHTVEEWAFLDAAGKALIRRVGEVARTGDASVLPQITLTDLDPSGTVGHGDSALAHNRW